MLAPAWRADVPMQVARLKTEPVHGRQVAGRVALVRMRDQLRLGSGSRRKVQEQRISGARDAVRGERSGVPVSIFQGVPSRDRLRPR